MQIIFFNGFHSLLHKAKSFTNQDTSVIRFTQMHSYVQSGVNSLYMTIAALSTYEFDISVSVAHYISQIYLLSMTSVLHFHGRFRIQVQMVW